MTIHEILSSGKKLLAAPCKESLISNPSLDASLLLAETLHVTREELIVRGNDTVPEVDREKFFALLERRRAGECVAYILGRKEFRGLDFTVNQGVLVPRPDTETLVEATLEYIDSTAGADNKIISLLDLCTGSGAIAISLKNERPFLDVTASDISSEALETASINSARHLKEPVRFIQSDLFENINSKFDIIVSNPPYVPSDMIDSLAPEPRKEPRLALDGGEDGLELIRKIILQVREYLQKSGVLLLEAAPEQMTEMEKLLETQQFSNIKMYKDLTGRERVISAQKIG